MKRFLINIALFAIIMLMIAVAADLVISKGLERTERGHFHTMNALMHDSINADVVILGNSRASGSYDPAIIDSVMHVNSRNLGVSGQKFGVSYLRWQLYNRHNVKPKLIIVNIDYSELGMVTNGFEREQYYPYMHDTLIAPYLDLYGFSWFDKYLPMWRYHGDYKLMTIGIGEFLHLYHDHKGNPYKGFVVESEDWNCVALDQVLSNGKVQCSCDSDATILLDKFLLETKTDGINVIMVYAPIYKDLKDNLEEDASMAIYKELSAKYEVPIMDYSAMSICEDTAYFKDGNHVNSKGAEYFTIKLSQDLVSNGY